MTNEEKIKRNYERLKSDMIQSGMPDVYFILHQISGIQFVLESLLEKLNET